MRTLDLILWKYINPQKGIVCYFTTRGGYGNLLEYVARDSIRKWGMDGWIGVRDEYTPSHPIPHKSTFVRLRMGELRINFLGNSGQHTFIGTYVYGYGELLPVSLNLRTTLSKCMRNPAMCKAAGRKISGSRSSTFSTFIHSSWKKSRHLYWSISFLFFFSPPSQQNKYK